MLRTDIRGKGRSREGSWEVIEQLKRDNSGWDQSGISRQNKEVTGILMSFFSLSELPNARDTY